MTVNDLIYMALRSLAQGNTVEATSAWLAGEFRDNGHTVEDATSMGERGYVPYVPVWRARATGSETPYN